jgi:D-alanine-D-alanine ligase
VAADAPPDEQDVEHEVGVVATALADLGFRTRSVPLGLDLGRARHLLLRLRPALVFNLVEAVAGRGSYIHLGPALLEDLDLPCTGAPLAAQFLSSNKLVAKRLMSLAGLPTPVWSTEGAPAGRWDGPWIVKSVWEHASIGMDDSAVLACAEAVPGALRERRARLGGEWLAEGFVDGRELNLALLAGAGGVQVLPAAEIRFDAFPPGKPRIVGYAAKWDASAFEYHHTPRHFLRGADDAALCARLGELALGCWHLFGLRGHARVDFRVDARGSPWVLEVNANPCLAPDAGFAAALAQGGLTLTEAVRRIVADTPRLPPEARALVG